MLYLIGGFLFLLLLCYLSGSKSDNLFVRPVTFGILTGILFPMIQVILGDDGWGQAREGIFQMLLFGLPIIGWRVGITLWFFSAGVVYALLRYQLGFPFHSEGSVIPLLLMCVIVIIAECAFAFLWQKSRVGQTLRNE